MRLGGVRPVIFCIFVKFLNLWYNGFGFTGPVRLGGKGHGMQITDEDRRLFADCCRQVLEEGRVMGRLPDQGGRGIGTLGEKTIHAVLKRYLEPRSQYHEQRVDGFVADILSGGEVLEIQTQGFDRLRRKLEAFLRSYEVTVVYPIPAVKWVNWLDEGTGEIVSRRKSPKAGSYYQAFQELYKIKPYLTHPSLHLRLLLIDMEEYRLLNGWSRDRKKGSTRYDRIPTGLSGELMVNGAGDYRLLVPDTLPETFLSKDYKRETKLTLNRAQTALNVLSHVGAVERVGKSGNSILYQCVR